MSVVPGTAQAGPQSIFKKSTEPSSIEKAAQRCYWRGGPTALCFGCIPRIPRVWFSTRLSHRLKPLVGGDEMRRHGRSTLGVESITSPRFPTYATRGDHVASLLTFHRVSSGTPSPGPLISIQGALASGFASASQATPFVGTRLIRLRVANAKTRWIRWWVFSRKKSYRIVAYHV
jgi:hypothetical protein